MSTPEERLAALLHDGAVDVRGDGLSRIQARVARRTRVRRVLVPAAALSVTALAAGLFLLGGPDERSSLQPGGPSSTAPPTGFFCYAPITDGSTCPPDATPPPEASSPPEVGPALWPFTTTAAADGWKTTAPEAQDKKALVARYLSEVLGLKGLTTSTTCESCDIVAINLGSRHVADAALERIDLPGAVRVFTIDEISTGGLRVTQPTTGEAITSPTTVTGTLDHGVDENVRLSLLSSDGRELAQGGAPAGSEQPWSGTLTWTDTSWSHGAVVGQTFSPKDGSLTRLFAVPVTRGSAPSGSTFAGLVDGHVSLFDQTGAVVRQLTYPPSGTRDGEPSWNGSRLVWARATGTCSGQVLELTDGRASVVASLTAALPREPQISDDGAWIAWVDQPCDGSQSTVVRRGPTPGPTFGSDAQMVLQAVRNDGALLLEEAKHTLFVPPGKTGGDAIELRTPGCVSGPADFDGITTNAWAQCGSQGQLVRYDDGGATLSQSPLLPISERPTLISLQGDEALFWLAGGDAVGAIAHYYRQGQVTTVVSNAGCTSTSEPKGCVREPSW